MDKVCNDKLQPYIDRCYQEIADYTKAYAQKMQMKREGLSNKGIWTAKKRYILNVYNNEGVQYNEPDMKVMGLEMVKSSTPQVIREKMKQAIKLMIQGTEQDIHKFIADFKEEFKNLPPEDISSPRGCNGLAKKYPLIQEGEKLKYSYLKMPNPFKDTVISFPGRLPKEFGLHDYIDYDTQFDKAFVEPIKVILHCMGWKTEKTSTLEDFFS
jgi:DNA polymerase elongation subunit (family B)